jgi:hypothetical protein
MTQSPRIAADERKALERALATLDALTPATPRDDAIAFDLRYASRHLAGARAESVPSARSRAQCAKRGGRFAGPADADARDDRNGAAGRRGGARSASGLN